MGKKRVGEENINNSENNIKKSKNEWERMKENAEEVEIVDDNIVNDLNETIKLECKKEYVKIN